jgi:hypothetical protein
MWSIDVGDIVHNFRSTLDHIVWDLAGCPPRKVAMIQFPIYEFPLVSIGAERRTFSRVCRARPSRLLNLNNLTSQGQTALSKGGRIALFGI